MFKVILAFLFMAPFLLNSSEDIQYDLNEWQRETVLYFAHGSAHLLMAEPQLALENFQKASSFLDKSDSASSALGFLICFGEGSIAYDGLELRAQCRQSIGSLCLDYFNDEEFAEDDEEVEIDTQVTETAVEFMRRIVRHGSLS